MGDRLGTRGAVGFLLFLHALRIHVHGDHWISIWISMGSAATMEKTCVYKSLTKTFLIFFNTVIEKIVVWLLASCSGKILLSLANGHITLNAPVLVRSLKLSNVEPC